MARRIVIAEDVRAVSPDGELRVPPDAVVTAAAREAAQERGVRILFSDQNPAEAGGDDRRRELIEQIAQQVLDQLSGSAPRESRPPAGDETLCAGCDERCVARCPERARRLVSAGASRLSGGGDLSGLPGEIAPLIDHTLLKPEASAAEIARLCEEARQYGFASVCVNPAWVALAAAALRGSGVKVGTVAGFPLGATLTTAKAFEAEQAVKLGAQEVDMVIHIGALKSRQYERVEQDIRAVADACHRGGALTKVILECALLTDEEKVRACCLARRAGADFVKTSTGFGPGGATVHDVELMRGAAGSAMGVKAAGGIRSYEDAKKMVSAGATRIGASAGVKIVQESLAGAAEAAAETPGAGPRY
jgi:deoxyribose-phosphate aldolase